MQATMQSHIVRIDDVLCVRVIGAVDVETAPTLRQQVQKAWIDGLHRLELDFAAVDYISSPGIALLLEFRHWLAKENAPVLLTAASQRVREVLATCRLDTMFLTDGNAGTHVPVAG